MSNESNGQETGGGKRLLPLGIAIVMGLLVGGGAGAFLAGPLLAARADAPASAGSAAEEDHAVAAGAEAGGGHRQGGGAPQALYLMDNVVLNPANSGGTRFLMVTIAFDLRSEVLSDEMEARDPEVRDVVLRTLGAKTVTELADVTARDSLKVELGTKVSELFHDGAVRHVYFPQFVIQ